MEQHHNRLEQVSGIVMIVVTAFVATLIISLINAVCR